MAAAGHQQHGLLPPFGQAAKPLHQGPTDQPAVAVLQLQSHVHQPHRRQGPAPDPFGQAQQGGGGCRPLAGLPGVQGRGGAAEHEPGATATGPVPGHIPGVIAGHGAVLLIGTVVLLIEHDQAQVADRQEHRRAGSHHHKGRPIRLEAAAPGGDALALAATAVKFGHGRAKSLAAAIQQLGHQADFGGQEQHPLARRQAIGGRLQIHLGFASTGDAPEQQALSRRRAANLIQGGGLGGGEGLGWGQLQAAGPLWKSSGLGHQGLFAHQAAPLQAIEHRTAEATTGQQLRLPGAAAMAGQVLANGLLLGREGKAWEGGRRCFSAQGHPNPAPGCGGRLGRALPQPARRQGAFEGAKQTGVAIAGHVLDQSVPLAIHRRPLVQRLDRQERHVPKPPGPLQQGFHHQANVAPPPQGHPH